MYIFNAINVDKLFPQQHPLHPEIRIVYVHGERFYVSKETGKVLTSGGNYDPSTAPASVAALTPTAPVRCELLDNGKSSSPRSVTSSSVGGGSGSISSSGGACSGSRAIGKRNQQFYLPDGCVKLMHISVDSACASAIAASTHHSKINLNDASGEHAHAHKWYGRYDKEKNTIMRTTADYELPESVDIMEYETLSHFAQEHDKECWGNDYIPSNTHNVWKNPYFLYFNTVTLEWEPLNKLR